MESLVEGSRLTNISEPVEKGGIESLSVLFPILHFLPYGISLRVASINQLKRGSMKTSPIFKKGVSLV